MELARTDPTGLAEHAGVVTAALAVARVPRDHPDALAEALATLVARAEEALHGGEASESGELVLLAAPDTPVTASAAATQGFEARRDLVQLRRPLPLAPELVASARSLPLRSFRPGEDDAAWLRVNRRAFDWHPEQGDWRQEDLATRLAEPWFDPEGFLVLDGPEGTMYGFCWTKVHPATHEDPELGEIFVIGVDPAAHGHGMGRALVVAGLEHLAAAGQRTAMLYTEADNEPALALYRSLGFADHEHTRWYHRQLGTSV